jgi:hypothetical protein
VWRLGRCEECRCKKFKPAHGARGGAAMNAEGRL